MLALAFVGFSFYGFFPSPQVNLEEISKMILSVSALVGGGGGYLSYPLYRYGPGLKSSRAMVLTKALALRGVEGTKMKGFLHTEPGKR